MAKKMLPEITAMSDQAINWIILLHSGNATQEDTDNAQQWRKRSLAHEAAYREALLLWQDMGSVMEAEATQTDVSLVIDNETITSRYRIGPGYLVSVVVAAMLLILIMPFSRYADQWQSDYHTDVGGQQRVTLADGSVIQLNTDSALSIQYQPNRRLIKLHRGQAIFTVSTDPRRPFEVMTKNTLVTALGTIFEVWDHNDETRVTVLEHAVQLSTLDHATAKQSVRIDSGQQIRYHHATGIHHTEAADIAQNSAWQRGKLIFKNQALADVIVELERYFPGRIFITNKKIRALKVSGVFPVQTPPEALEMIENTLAIEITHFSPWVILLHD